MNILTIDIGGTNVKLLATGQAEPRKFPSGPELGPHQLIAAVRSLTEDWEFDVVSIGYPGPVAHGQPQLEPRNLGTGWVGFDFAAAFERPVKIINDAALQALGSYEGGRMLFIGLGTGVGSTLIAGKAIVPLDLGQLYFHDGQILDDILSRRALDQLGKEKWTTIVCEAIAHLKHCFIVDYVMIGGGNAKKLKRLPPGARQGDNERAFLGGYRLWNMSATLTPATHPPGDEGPPRSDWKIV